MNKIRYRAFDKHMKAMGEVTSIRFFDHLYDHVSVRFTIRGKKIDEGYNVGYDGSDNIILMQDTGLKDKNGVKIFEGDIVKTHFSFKHNVEQEPFIITWNKDKAMFEGVKPEKNKDDYLRSFSFFPEQEFIYEVIGNIHDNPEMMEDLDA